MAKGKKNTQDTQEITASDVETISNVIRPNDLAKELDVDPKRVRAFLRDKFSRDSESKNTNWELTPDMVSAVRERFTTSNDEDEPAE